MIKEKEKKIGFLCYHFFQKKQKTKTKSGSKRLFLLMMTIHKAKSSTQVHFRLGRGEWIFLKNNKQQKKHINLNKE